MLLFPSHSAEIIEPGHILGKMLANGFGDGNHYLFKGQPALTESKQSLENFNRSSDDTMILVLLPERLGISVHRYGGERGR
ncbi:hypothetical protein [Azotobacter salinestris]|uniref:hypothetical protein n=1 Tax=Azotobacter salinestris TaxID=69964 RepID=UPI001266E409|nr:hypothetical protein [Azotobacter salinestris]